MDEVFNCKIWKSFWPSLILKSAILKNVVDYTFLYRGCGILYTQKGHKTCKSKWKFGLYFTLKWTKTCTVLTGSKAVVSKINISFSSHYFKAEEYIWNVMFLFLISIVSIPGVINRSWLRWSSCRPALSCCNSSLSRVRSGFTSVQSNLPLGLLSIEQQWILIIS